ncbi:transcription-repair coupling factor [Candidatus Palauibacter polyketidifaciens]|uniref:transcription-repair coupling factor n=1 Tax=Candidatus Palauibacter polyketidifaciens TaxID=3056740 RepID=UPI0023904EA2|nr:transcription-repair coupling factor [Candidatus Palauibacter polyketidifaciens]MDE2719412.1 transcription-repair coupling factor [Candidatus Palauibacter polyketidifaciens]
MRAAGVPEALSRRGARALVHPLPGAGPAALALALDDLAVGAPVVLVAETPERADALHEDLRTLGASGARCYPQREALPYEDADPHVEIEAQRVEATGALLGGRCRILTTTARALAERAPIPVGPGTSLALTVRRGAAHPLAELGHRLEEMGFDRTHTVREVGDYAIRGGIVDLFPFGHPAPLRIELWGDEVESVRRFDALTQRSTEPLESVDVLPVALRSSETAGDVERRALVETLPPTALALILDPEGGVRARARLWDEVRDARKRVGAGAEPSESLVLPPSEAEQRLAAFRRLEFTAPEQGAPTAIRLPVEPPPAIDRDMKRLVAEIGTARARGERFVVFCDNDGQVERLEEILTERGGAALAREVALAIGSLSGGFRVGVPGTLLVLTDHEVFRRRYRRHRVRLRGAATIESIAAIEPGDYVVHMEHGIGRYMGLERVEVRGETIETMEIRYADGEILRLPHYRLDLIERWSAAGSDARPPTVHKLGRRKWKQLRNRTVAAIEATAVELLQLYARRKMSPGRAFPAETAWQREMESAFLYDETPDQLGAWEAVRRDLEAPVPMDRLVCGDVGFGKTEVAIRAAFKAVQDGAQVAVLAPTTILADQHLTTFRERLAGFPVHVEGLSRFRTPREQRKVVAGLRAGTIDIVIGTHRLLSRDVEFRDLGLLIVDEEQRFGVRQKERLKEYRETVDVLTLTATPIPRTLHLALGGLRDLSTIRTPPRNRMPIITHVLSWDDGILEEALRREFDRGGQVFFVHDRVETIRAVASRVERLMPEARAAIAHGQMPERDLEDVMHRFVRGELDLLICTSIIENGLDVPSANTMIVHRAQNFGLAQLYQLRGRVGRSHRRAYCYLVVPSDVAPDAAERLRVLEHHTELGSGYQVALKDLELRGAGNLLGGEQSGFATAVGIETWQRLVESTLRRLKGESSDPVPRARVSVDGESFLPDAYVAGSPVKMHLYRRLSRLTKWEEVKLFRAELEDRFGRLPPPAARLIAAGELRILGAAIGADWIRASDDDARISFEATASPQLRLLTNALADRQLHVEVRRLEPLSLVLRRAGTEPLLPMLVEALGILAAPGRAEARETRTAVTAGGV